MKKGLVLIIISIISILLYGIYQYNKPHKNILEAKIDISMSSSKLIDLYNTNTEKYKKFTNKILQITGKITLIEKSAISTILILDDGIKCEVSNSIYKKNAKEEETITIKGLYSGYDEMFNEIALIKCHIIN